MAGLESVSAVPLAHWGQLVVPPLEYVPTLHARQGVAGLESVSAVPGVHASHVNEPFLAYVPMPHDLHGVLGSESASALPAAQVVHFTAWAGANEPLGHFCCAPSHRVAGF